MDNTPKILENLGKGIIKDARKNLKQRKKDKHSSGKLSKSLKSRVKSSQQGNVLTIYAEDYALFVDQGTDDSRGNDFLTDAVDDNIRKYGDIIAEQIADDIILNINIE